jgi:hypothetical protein
LEKIVERIVIMPQVVEVLKYVHEITETESLGVAVGVEVQEQERKYKELYGITHSQLVIILTELKKLRSSQPALNSQIDLLVRYLTDFDKLAALQRIVSVDKERIVEKEVSKSVLIPTRDSESLRSELALSSLVEKLVSEIKRIKESNPQVELQLDNDIGLIFYPEFYDKQNIPVGDDFTNILREYTLNSNSKIQNIGGNWTNEHQFILYSSLHDRFATANLVKQANIEIEKVRAISDTRATALREKENQFLQASKLIV